MDKKDNNKYYQEIKEKILQLISEEKLDEARKIVQEELSMPYIPREFEEFLQQIDVDLFDNSIGDGLEYNLSVGKIIEILLQVDNDEDDSSILIDELNKFNLSSFQEDIQYFFDNSEKTTHRLLVLDILVNQKVDMDIQGYGNPKDIKAIKEYKEYTEDHSLLIDRLDKYPIISGLGEHLLKCIYTSIYVGIDVTKVGLWTDFVIYTISLIFEEEEIKELIVDIENVNNKLEMFETINNL